MSKLNKYIAEVYDDRDMPDSTRRNLKPEEFGTDAQFSNIAEVASHIQKYCETLRDNEDLSGEGLMVLAKIEHYAERIIKEAIHE